MTYDPPGHEFPQGPRHQSPVFDPTQGREAAWRLLFDPALDPSDLGRIAAVYPEFAAIAAGHPRLEPAVAVWLAGLGRPDVDAALAARGYAAPPTPATVPAQTVFMPGGPQAGVLPAGPGRQIASGRGSLGGSVSGYPAQPRRRRKGLLIGACAVVAVLALAGGAWFGFPKLRGLVDPESGASTPKPVSSVGSEWAGSSPSSSSEVLPFARTLGGAGYDEFSGVAVTADGGIIAVGMTESTAGDFAPSKGSYDALAARFSPDGVLLWSQTLGGSELDEFSAVAATADGGIIAAGSTSSANGDFVSSADSGGALVARLSPDGVLLWSKTLGGVGYDAFSGVAVAADGAIIAAGFTAATNRGSSCDTDSGDALLARFSPDGELVWTQILGGCAAEELSAVTVAANGDLIAAGYTESTDGDFAPSKGAYDALAARFSPDGELLWSQTVGMGDDAFWAVAVTADGGIITAGSTDDASLGSGRALVARFSPDGELLWSQIPGGRGYDAFWAVAATADGGVIACGSTEYTGGDSASLDSAGRALVARFSPDGELLWSQVPGGTHLDFLLGLVATTDGGIVGTGSTWSTDGDFPSSNGGADALILRLTPDGTFNTE